METKTLQEVLYENKMKHRKREILNLINNKKQRRKRIITNIILVSIILGMFALCVIQQINIIEEEQVKVVETNE